MTKVKDSGREEPLGLPRGSVRAIVTLTVAGCFPLMLVLAALGVGIPESWMGFYTVACMLVLKDYFGQRGSKAAEESGGSWAV